MYISFFFITILHITIKVARKAFTCILGQPSARELMSIIASTGLAQNFTGVRPLTTTGIQKGHMKMHLQNILNQLEASDNENMYVCIQTNDDHASYSKVRQMIESYRYNL